MDKNRFTITINDSRGIKQYHLHEIMKKVILYSIVGLAVVFAAGGFFIYYLNYSLDTITQKKESTQMALNSLAEKNSNLENILAEKEKAIATKKHELDVVADKLSDIEQLIGLKEADVVDEDESLVNRLDSVSMSGQKVAFMLENIPSGYPIKYKGTTSKYGYRVHPKLNRREFHRGIDLRARMNTPLYAPASGVIEYAGHHRRSGYGKLIILDHAFGFKTMYGHLNKFATKPGSFVKKGDLIGYTGNTGMSNGPHLHYEVRYIQRVLDPTYFVKWSAKNYKEIFKKEKRVSWQSLITAINHQKSTITQPSLRKDLLSKERWSSPAHFILMETLKAPFAQVVQSQWDEMAKLMAKSLQKK
ncbi:MAG: M23 family metallopeptidase [Thiovulaceae bacterium]|nr:M23 family metallopeptidase [Sulfurimonadaceae bacterium]